MGSVLRVAFALAADLPRSHPARTPRIVSLSPRLHLSPDPRYSFSEHPSSAPVYLQRTPGSPPPKPSLVTITASAAQAPPESPEQEIPGIKKQTQESWAWGGKTLRSA